METEKKSFKFARRQGLFKLRCVAKLFPGLGNFFYLGGRKERREAAELSTKFCAAIHPWRTTKRERPSSVQVSCAQSVGGERREGPVLVTFLKSLGQQPN